jgi:hypothetical protein
MGMPLARSILALAAAALAAAAGTGCLQIEAHVTLHEDGGATITERLRFSRALLDQAGPREAELLKLLSEGAARDRMKLMGKGISLVRHSLRDAEGGSKESVTEFKIPDINDFTYTSPWLSFLDYPENSAVKFQLEPLYKSGSSSYQDWVGHIRVCVTMPKRPKGIDDGKDPKKPPEKGPSPQEQQIYRELAPVFRDMLKGFQLRLTFEAYGSLAPFSGSAPIRNVSAGATSADLINFSSENLDNFGSRFLDNEEIMLELVRWQWAAPNIVANVQNYGSNHTLPVFMPRSRSDWFNGTCLYVRPSRALFDRYFAGKDLDHRPWGKDPPAPADFEKIGWKGQVKKPAAKTEGQPEGGGK